MQRRNYESNDERSIVIADGVVECINAVERGDKVAICSQYAPSIGSVACIMNGVYDACVDGKRCTICYCIGINIRISIRINIYCITYG